eukprot:482988_1
MIKWYFVMDYFPQLGCQFLYAFYTTQQTGNNPSQNTILSFITSSLSIIGAILSYLMEYKSKKNCIVVKYEINMNKANNSALDDDEKQEILQNKERKKQLTKSLSAALGIEGNMIEIGAVFLQSDGIIIPVIQYIFIAELDFPQHLIHQT